MKNAILTGLLMACVSLSHADATLTCKAPTPPLNDAAIQKFAETTALQSFTYDFESLPTHLNALENCYTKTGWQSFSLALQRSGNIDTAKHLKLHAKALRTGPIRTLSKEATDDAWRVLIPIKVVYRNDEQTMTQNLDVKLLVNIENNKVGVEQITASPSLPSSQNQTVKHSVKLTETREDNTLSTEKIIHQTQTEVSHRHTPDTASIATVRTEVIKANNEKQATQAQQAPVDAASFSQPRTTPSTPRAQQSPTLNKTQATLSQQQYGSTEADAEAKAKAAEAKADAEEAKADAEEAVENVEEQNTTY